MSKKTLDVKQLFAPEPVLIVGTYDEDGTPNAMNVAWGGQISQIHLALNIGTRHKTTENLKARGAFTVALADKAHLVQADYVGIESGNSAADKIAKAGLTPVKAETVDAPYFDEFPLSMECKLVSMEEEVGGEVRVIGEVTRVVAEESAIGEDGKFDLDKAQIISFDMTHNAYRVIGEKVGNAFSDGAALK